MVRSASKNDALAIDVAAFAATMPDAYRLTFDAQSVAQHAAIVARRGDAVVQVEVWRDGGTELSICVVADDRPGLLTQVTAALVAHDLDVVDADAFCRTRTDGVVEAVDLLRVRRNDGSTLAARELAPVQSMIAALCGGKATLLEPELPPPSRSRGGARLVFDTDPRSGVTVLSVEAYDRPGLLLAITQVLYRSGLQIVGLSATTRGDKAIDRFQLVELDGSALAQDRRLDLQLALLVAIDETSR